MKKFSKLITIILGTIMMIGCDKENNDIEKESPIQGAELAVMCKNYVKETLFVKVISGEYEEDFGVIGSAPNNRDGGAVVGFSPIKIGKKLIVKWGVDGKDDLAMENEYVFDTKKLLKFKGKIKTIELMYLGNKKWQLNAYDSSWSAENKKKIAEID